MSKEGDKQGSSRDKAAWRDGTTREQRGGQRTKARMQNMELVDWGRASKFEGRGAMPQCREKPVIAEELV